MTKGPFTPVAATTSMSLLECARPLVPIRAIEMAVGIGVDLLAILASILASKGRRRSTATIPKLLVACPCPPAALPPVCSASACLPPPRLRHALPPIIYHPITKVP
jgi:hypothetical protein